MRALSRLRDGLVGAWCPSVSGWGGNVLRDLSGQGNHGTLTNMDPATDWVVSEGKQALDFDGVDDYVVHPTIKNAFSLQASLVLWLQLNNAVPLSSGRTGFVQTRTTSSGTASHYPWIDGFAYLNTFRDNRVNSISLSASVVRTNLHMVTITTNPIAWKMFQNDIEIHSVSGESSITFNANSFNIGRTNDTGNSYYLDGRIFDVRLYNRILSPSEIRNLYDGGPGFGLRPERTRRYVQGQTFTAARLRRQSLIGSGVY